MNPSQLVNVNLTARTSDWTPPTVTFGEALRLACRFTIQNNGSAIDPGMTLTGMRAVVGRVDARAAGGATSLVIGAGDPSDANTTAAIAWNATATAVAAAINALAGVVATYGTAKVAQQGQGGSYLIFFGTRSQEVPITCLNNALWPVSFVRVSAWKNGNEWVHQVRFTQAPVAFTSTDDIVLPPAPTITRILAGGTTDGIATNEIQAVYIPPNFLGTYVITLGLARSGTLSVADDPTTMTAALAILGNGFSVTNPLPNTAFIEFIGTFAGAAQSLLGITVISAPAGDPTLTLKFDRAELLMLLQGQSPATLPLEVWISTVDSTTGETAEIAAFVTPVTIQLPANFSDLEDTPTVDWLRPTSPRSYVPFGVDNVLTGLQCYTTTLGDGEATSFDVTHGLDTEAVFVFLDDGSGNQLAGKVDYTVKINSANDVTVASLVGAPGVGAWTVYVLCVQTVAAWAEGLTVSIGQVTGLGAALAAIGAELASITALLPTAPPSLTTGSGGTLTITIPPLAGFVPMNTTASNGQPKARALLPAQFALVSGIADGTFPLTEPGAAGTVVKNATGVAQQVPAGFGIDETRVPAGGYVASDGRLWYLVNQAASTNSFFPAAFERTLFSFAINSAMLTAGSTFSLAFQIALQMLVANTRAQYLAVIELGALPEDSSPSPVGLNLQNVVWNTASPILAQQVILSEVGITHSFGCGISLDKTGEIFTAQKVLYGVTTGGATTPSSANFAIRARLIQFDTEDGVARPKGVVSYALSGATAGIAQG